MPDATDLPDYFHFHHPLVRDLCWTLSPAFDLLEALPPYRRFVPTQSPEVLRKWLEHLQHHPQPLEAFVAEASRRRLGLYFERLILFYLSHAPQADLRVLDHNRRIYTHNSHGNRVTVGELDFLLTSATATVHLETAVKFFLGFEHAGEVHWLGPGLQDRLDRKLDRLRSHQLPLSQRLETRFEAPFQRYFWVKGILFQPWRLHLAAGAGLLVHSGENNWLTCSQAMECLEEGDWFYLPKSRWLGGECDDEEKQPVNRERIERHFAENNRVLMLAHTRSGARRLIVSDDWPAAARAALQANSE